MKKNLDEVYVDPEKFAQNVADMVSRYANFVGFEITAVTVHNKIKDIKIKIK